MTSSLWKGPSLSVVRWWGDLSVQLNYRRGQYQGGRSQQFAGLEFIFPLTPRDTRSLGPVHIEGNGGRLGPEYVMSQVGRMREAFLLFGGR